MTELECWEDVKDAYKLWIEIVERARPVIEALNRKIVAELLEPWEEDDRA